MITLHCCFFFFFFFFSSRRRHTRCSRDWSSDVCSSDLWINDAQARLTEIPAPPFQEEARASAVSELLSESGLPARVDKIGNVIGELRGATENEIVMLSAHLDTVFPAGTDVKVHRNGNRMTAPGISDNGSGIAALVAIARALEFAHIKPDRKSTRLNSSHGYISYAVFCLK